ncbi:MAG: hypothetical protein E7672_01295 [Ruminococcaceae bacterium]|nr:hypothetical protein [Oscillospiraceae bacterium]
MNGFTVGNVEYRSYIGEDENYDAVYAKYRLENAAVRELFSVDEEATLIGDVTLYYFPERCRCLDSSGKKVSFPRPKAGDICVLDAGEEAERSFRVAEVGYFTGSSELSHIRLKLK